MAKSTYSHRSDGNGKPRVVRERNLPKGMRGVDPEYDVHTFTEGPLARLFGRKR